MDKFTKSFFALILLLGMFSGLAKAQSLYQVDIKDDIGPNAWRTINKAYQKALSQKSTIFLVELNTFGGAVNFADSIRSTLLNSKLKTVVYINHNAASAGALISLAADEIFMQKGASLGAASVVNQQGEIMPEKYQSYMRGLMRATAEAKGRDPKIAEAFVDSEVSIPALKPDGKLLTLTASEAVKAGIVTAEVQSITEVYSKLGISTAQVVMHERSFIDRVIALLIHPMVSGFLILGIIGGIYFELQTPGIGFALVVALGSAALFFAPLYLQGLADHWEIAVFVIGLLLLVLEVFVIPGFGIVGVLGVICIVCGLALSMVSNDFLDFKFVGSGMLINSFLIVGSSMVLSVVLMVLFGKNLLKSRAFKRLVLQDEQTAESGYVSSVPMLNLINKHAIARTVLRPSGKIEIDGVWYDAVALDGFVNAGEEVFVEKHENYNLFVRKIEDKPEDVN